MTLSCCRCHCRTPRSRSISSLSSRSPLGYHHVLACPFSQFPLGYHHAQFPLGYRHARVCPYDPERWVQPFWFDPMFHFPPVWFGPMFRFPLEWCDSRFHPWLRAGHSPRKSTVAYACPGCPPSARASCPPASREGCREDLYGSRSVLEFHCVREYSWRAWFGGSRSRTVRYRSRSRGFFQPLI